MLNRSVILVDGSNVHATMKLLRWNVDYKKLTGHLHTSMGYYFTALPPKEEISKLHPMIDWLDFNGWTVIQKEFKRFRDKETGDMVIKGNMDVEIATLAKEIAPHFNTIYLMTGDGDFTFLVQSLQRNNGVRCVVISSTTVEICAEELRRQANGFIELQEIRDRVERRARD